MNHIAMVVWDADSVVERLSLSGLGPFRVFRFSNDALIYGAPASYTLKLALCPLNPGVELEIVQTIEGNNEVHRRFLEKKGEGIEHLGFEVDDLEAAITMSREAGFDVILTRREGRPGSVYIDTTSVGGTITELIRKGFKPYDLSAVR